MQICRVLLLLSGFLYCLFLTGCLASLKAYPDRSYNPKKELEAMKVYLSEEAITKYNSTSNNDREGKTKRQWRNVVVNARIRAIDLHFTDFQQALFQEGVGIGIATDWLVLAMSGVGSLVDGASTALSAASAGVVGGKASFDKNAFFDKTMPTLLATMVANRKEILVRMRKGLQNDINGYPLTLALNNLDSYYNAGSIPGALTKVAETAGVDAKKADEELRETLFNEDESSKRIIAWLWPDGISNAPNQDNVTTLKGWINASIGDVPIQKLLDHKDLKDFRESAIKKIKIPELKE